MPVASTAYYYTCNNAGWAQGYAFPSRGTAFSRVGLQGVPTQCNVLDRYGDGSIKHAIWTAHVPSAGNYTLELDPAPNGLSPFTPTWPSASVTFSDGATYTASLPAFSVSDTDTWHDGPLAIERAYVVTPTASGTPHPLIQVTFDACGFSDGAYLIWVTITNVRDSAAQRPVTMSGLSITIGGVPVTILQTTKVIYQGNRYSFSGSGGGYVECIAHPDSEMLIACGLFPRILTSVSNNTYSQSGLAWEPGVFTGGVYFGDMNYSMGSPGTRPEIEPVDSCVAEYLVHHNPSQLAHSIGHGLMSGNWCGCQMQADGVTHVTSPDSGPLSQNGMFPYFDPEGPHLYQLCILPLVVTTRRLFLRIIQGWASFMPTRVINYIPQNTNSYSSDLSYDYTKHVDGMLCNLQASYGGEPRGYRVMKCWQDAWFMTPSREATAKEYWRQLTQENIDRCDAYGKLNPFHSPFNPPEYEFDPGGGIGSYGGVHYGYSSMSYWHVAYKCYSFMRAIMMGFSSDLSYLTRAVGAFLAYWNAAPVSQWEYIASWYYKRVCLHSVGGPHTVLDTWAAVFNNNHVAPIGGYDATDNGGSPGPPYYQQEYRTLLLMARWLGLPNYQAPLTYMEITYGALADAPARAGYALAGWDPAPPQTPATRLSVQQPLGTSLISGGAQSFGSVFTGSTSTLTFTILNTGNIDLTGLGITIDGTNASLFTVTTSPTAPVSGPSGRTTFVVRFAPVSIGAKTATLHLASNDATNPFNIVLTGTGSVPTPQIAVEQPSGTVVTPGAVRNFGSVIFGQSSSLTFTIRNTGTANLTGVGVTIDGTDASLFTVTASPTATIAPSGSTTCTVQFAPTTAGSKTATLHIASNDGTTNPFNVALTGTGTDVAVSHLSVEQPAGTQITSGAATGFGNVVIGSSTTVTFTVKNLGGASLTSVGVTIDGTDASMFTLSAVPSATVAGLGATTFTVTFTPTSSGLRTATAHLASSDATQNPFDIVLNGTGGSTPIAGTVYGLEFRGTSGFVQTGANHTYNVGETDLQTRIGLSFQWLVAPFYGCVNRNAAAFRVELAGGAVTNSATPAVLSITLPSTGPKNIRCALGDPYFSALSGQQLEILDNGVVIHTIGPIDVPGGSVADANGNVLSAANWLTGQTAKALVFSSTNCTIRLTALVNYATLAYFELEDTSGVQPPQIVVEQPAGTGLTSGATRNYGSVVNGSTSSLTFTIRNTGGSSLTGLIATVDGADAALFTVTASPSATVAASGSTTVTVRFAPTTSGAKAAALHLASNDAGSPFTIALAGTGTAVATPHLVVEQPTGTQLASGAVSDVGTVQIGNSGSLTFTVRNLGGASLTGIAVTIDGADASLFAVTAAPAATLPQSGSTAFIVRYLPIGSVVNTATVHIASNDGTQNPFDVVLRGTGTTVPQQPDNAVYTARDAGDEAVVVDLDAGDNAFAGFDINDPLDAGIEDDL